jgi:hypothetical protein
MHIIRRGGAECINTETQLLGYKLKLSNTSLCALTRQKTNI